MSGKAAPSAPDHRGVSAVFLTQRVTRRLTTSVGGATLVDGAGDTRMMPSAGAGVAVAWPSPVATVGAAGASGNSRTANVPGSSLESGAGGAGKSKLILNDEVVPAPTTVATTSRSGASA